MAGSRLNLATTTGGLRSGVTQRLTNAGPRGRGPDRGKATSAVARACSGGQDGLATSHLAGGKAGLAGSADVLIIVKWGNTRRELLRAGLSVCHLASRIGDCCGVTWTIVIETEFSLAHLPPRSRMFLSLVERWSGTDCRQSTYSTSPRLHLSYTQHRQRRMSQPSSRNKIHGLVGTLALALPNCPGPAENKSPVPSPGGGSAIQVLSLTLHPKFTPTEWPRD